MNDSRSRIEMLEGRVHALEQMLQGKKEETPAIEKIADADDVTERVFNIITNWQGGKSPDETTASHLFSTENLKRGIRAALNEFYRGPSPAHHQLLLKEMEKLKEVNASLAKSLNAARAALDYERSPNQILGNY
jgi:hypothetical protein